MAFQLVDPVCAWSLATSAPIHLPDAWWCFKLGVMPKANLGRDKCTGPLSRTGRSYNPRKPGSVADTTAIGCCRAVMAAAAKKGCLSNETAQHTLAIAAPALPTNVLCRRAFALRAHTAPLQ